MTPDKAKELAREWYGNSGLVPDEHQVTHDAHFACTDAEPFEQCANRIRQEMTDKEIDSLAALIERVSLETKVWAFELIEGKSVTDSVMIYAQEFSKAKGRLATLSARGGDDVERS